ncbi:hypothetical protein F3J29_17100 [Enterobacter sp. Cy-643]|uniref:hypothetical protein n=1 Tax=Enterobacter sp. Cy-643 TaxID=2608346 RepID=UPI00141F7BD0|nr:hypothetical protein [Enterobacter sp. Cy-643]NIF33847.1 hypothetical protein [Enterobacter sp. Cy-643]
MANHDSTTTANPQSLGFQPVTQSEISTLLKTPLGTSNDLFQVLDICERYTDALIENNDITERMALCGRLYAGLEVLKVVLDKPLPEHLIASITAENSDIKSYDFPLTTESDLLREYCSALTLVLLNQQESTEQEDTITGLLFELINVLNDSLRAPRFVRTDSGLAMIDSQSGNNIH